MVYSFLLLIFISSALFTYLIVPRIITFSYYIKALDQPNQRKIHAHPIPRLGGISIFLPIVLLILSLLLSQFDIDQNALKGILFGIITIFVIGLLDDLYKINPLIKFLGQLLSGTILFRYGIGFEMLRNPFGGVISLKWLSFPATLFWVATIINAFNIIDGLDGLAAGIGIFSSIIMAIFAFNGEDLLPLFLITSMVGSLFAFLRYNFYPASIFLGDSGSMLIGFIIAAISIHSSLKASAAAGIFVPLVALGHPIMEVGISTFRRLLSNVPISKADKDHIHHRLLRMGFSHKASVIILYITTIFFCFIAVILVFANSYFVAFFLGIFGAFIFIVANKFEYINISIIQNKLKYIMKKNKKDLDHLIGNLAHITDKGLLFGSLEEISKVLNVNLMQIIITEEKSKEKIFSFHNANYNDSMTNNGRFMILKLPLSSSGKYFGYIILKKHLPFTTPSYIEMNQLETLRRNLSIALKNIYK
ncbi:MAG: hypothetical protein DRG20_05170 [Deltaproteobacteria bacterium]|nr:MAG: hypothetical protein DRG20_05170 [Deltaproteobacteria bacterium]